MPLLTLLIPLIPLTHPIYRWYEVLRRIDQDLSCAHLSRSVLVHRAELERIEVELREISVPLSCMEEFYNLCLHLEIVRRRVDSQDLARAA